MQVTGKEFDIDPKSFTLGSMFAMSLDKVNDEILKITSAAEKELTIENELRKLVEVWKEQKFSLVKYTKGTEDRGFILRGVEDITLLLEDLGLNLQSMMASPFVRPFIDEVRKWEQKLSLIGECTEAWMQVQRKWMYLESIFVGSDDIRQQLPQVRALASLLQMHRTNTWTTTAVLAGQLSGLSMPWLQPLCAAHIYWPRERAGSQAL
jgi:dynein heavy chain, axonemal